MNKIALIFAGSLLAFSAIAQTTPPQDTVPADAKILVSGADKARASDRHCLRQTGSRVIRKDKAACINAPGRSYDQDDIARTGAFDTADALRKLDVSVH